MSGHVTEKKCSKCGEVKPLDGFSVSNGFCGRSSVCKKCISAYHKAWYEENKQREIARVRAYQESNKEHIHEQKKGYREKNKDRIAEYAKAYREENKEQISERQNGYYMSNREHFLNYQKSLRESLANTYVASLVSSGTNLKPSDIPTEIVEIKRYQLEMKRITKHLVQELGSLK